VPHMTRGPGGRLSDRLARLSDRRFMALVYLTALALYLIGLWLHLSNGGNVYNGITDVFQQRICPPPSIDVYPQPPPSCTVSDLSVPYLQSFNEYPVITAMFMYAMGILGGSFPGDLITNYYLVTGVLLVIPMLLGIRELMKIGEIRGTPRNRTLWYFVVTPTFLIMSLLSWYVIGVYFTLYGIRKYLEGGSRLWTGVLFGLSAASNFVTAVPALGLLIHSKTTKERVLLAAAALGTYAAINAPFFVLNSGLWLQSFHYDYTWNIENSWMQAILINLYSPYRHVIPPIVFGGFIVEMLWLRYRRKTDDPLAFAFLAMFGYTFATYIYPPQLNLMLLPFFVLLPVTNSYREFLAFDVLNALIIILGFSEVLLAFGITYSGFFRPGQSINYMSVVFWIEVVRSLWQGKFAVVNGIPGLPSLRWLRRGKTRPAIPSQGVPVLHETQDR
jgi:hypothetical protein